MSSKKNFTGLRTKLVRLMLATLILSGVAILTAVASIQVNTAKQSLTKIESQIKDSIKNKGRVLAKSHAIALKGMALDNAFGAMNELVAQAVHDDGDLIYGLFLSADAAPWAYAGPNVPKAPEAKQGQPPPQVKLNPKAWLALGLDKADQSITKLASKERHLFDNDVIEFAMPIADEGELLGTIRYGVSTQRMQAALTEARELSAAALKRTLWILGGIVLLATLLMVGLSFRSATKITRPLDVLTAAASKLAKGDRDVRVNIDSADELERLGDSFNAMVQDLKISYDQLEDLNKNLEQRVEERTRELLARNEDMRMVLDNVDQGLVTISPDGTLAGERSAAFDAWFPRSANDQTLAGTLGCDDEDRQLALQLAWESVEDGFLPLELSLEQMPNRFEINGRHYALQYKSVSDGDELRNVLLVVSDVTSDIERAKTEKRQREFINMFQRVANDRSGFVEFFNEAQRIVDALLVPGRTDREVFMRELHTLKGNCGIFGIHSIAELSHAFEDELNEESRLPTTDESEAFSAGWQEFSERVHSLISNKQEDIVEISYAELQGLIRLTKAQRPMVELTRQLERLKLEHIKVRFVRIAQQIEDLVKKLHKCHVKVEFQMDDVRLPADRWASFWSNFAHVVRNAVDHGLETPEERAATTKPETARVVLSARQRNGYYVIQIQDDGRGIAWEKIREKAKAANLPSSTQEDLSEALFSDGISSQDQVSQVSGRGVGMSAVRDACKSLGGQITVQSESGVGTTFEFKFPTVENQKPLLTSTFPGTRPSLAPPSQTLTPKSKSA